MRVYLLWIIVLLLICYAWRNWFISLCGLIILSVIMQRQDFPQMLFGINGLNPWNMLFLSVVAAWAFHRHSQRTPLDLPPWPKRLMIVFFIMIFIAYVRAVFDLDSIPYVVAADRIVSDRPGVVGFTGDFLINRIKYIIPGLLLFDACRTRQRMWIGVGVVLFSAFFYALLVARFVPVTTLFSSSESEFMAYRHRIDRDVGLMAIDMSMMLAGAFWAMAAVIVHALKRPLLKVVMLVPLGVILLSMALCHSRGSYISFAAAAFVMAVVRWRWLLLLFPICLLGVFMFVPAVPARLGMGCGVTDYSGEAVEDWDEITAGRSTELWPPAIEQIGKNPVIGFGGFACKRTEVWQKWYEAAGQGPTHPHNAYLELLIDMGLMGFVPIMVLFIGIFVMSIKVFRSRGDPLSIAVGGGALASVTVLLVAALACQSFYPTQSTILSWCLWSMCLRAAVDAKRAKSANANRVLTRQRVVRSAPRPRR